MEEKKGENKEITKKIKGKSLIDRILDFAFSNDDRKWLILIILLGAILRLIVMNHVAPIADESVHGTHAINIISSGVINEQNECPAWFYLTDISYRIFGINAFGGRFLSFLFGLLSIPLVYLIGKRIFNKKIGILSAFLLSISAFVIRYTLMEMDIAMMFFVMLSFYFFIKGMDYKQQLSYLSVIAMGIAILFKPIALTFIPALGLYFVFILYKSSPEDRKSLIKKNTNRIIISAIIILLFVTPILAYNYILYHQKGIVDVLFARFLDINKEIYSGLQGYDKSFSFREVITMGLPFLIQGSFFVLDPAISFLAILGIMLVFSKKDYRKGIFLCLFPLVAFIFLLGGAQLQTHFSSFMPILSILAAAFIYFAFSFIGGKKGKIFLISLLIIVFIVNLIVLSPYLTSKAGIFKLRSYAVSDTTIADIIVTDSRIYRGQVAWAFNDRAYLEASYFSQLMNLNQNSTGNKIQTRIIFVECAVDDCGWGTIKNQPDLNASMEDLFRQVSQSAQEKIIYGGGGSGKDDVSTEAHFKIYILPFQADALLYNAIYQTHDWFYYPVRWEKDDWYDKYTPEGELQTLFNLLGKIMLWLTVILAALSPIILFKELLKDQDHDNGP